jgi:integrase
MYRLFSDEKGAGFMLIKCRECGAQVSDMAVACPRCGYPVSAGINAVAAGNNQLSGDNEVVAGSNVTSNSNIAAKKRRRKPANENMRLPNGFGQISRITNRNLRNPYRVMVCVGRNEKGRPISRLLKPQAYFPTYNEAYAALLEYNRHPYDLDPGKTVKETYDEWSDKYFRKLKNYSSIKATETAWAYCSQVYEMRVKDLRARHIKACMDSGTITVGGKTKTPTSSMKNKIKTLFNQMLDYAFEYELVERNYARTFKLNEETIREIQTVKKEHIPFTEEEMERLWSSAGDKWGADIVLIQCYSGWRPQELGLIELADVDLQEWTFTGGMKTEAGTGRIVPIHPRIRPIVAKYYQQAVELGSSFLFNFADPDRKNADTRLTYNRYARIFERLVAELGLNPNHRPHDGRKHFVTKAKECGVDEYAIKYIVGHKILDITEKVYTKRETSWLAREMEKIE